MGHAWSWATPPISAKDCEKKIQELETVEQWMKVNLNMLQLTINALKHQKAMTEMMGSIPQAMQAGISPASPNTTNKTQPNTAPPTPKSDTTTQGSWGDWSAMVNQMNQAVLSTINATFNAPPATKKSSTKSPSAPTTQFAKTKKPSPAHSVKTEKPRQRN